LLDKAKTIEELLPAIYDDILNDKKEQALKRCTDCFAVAEDLVKLAQGPDDRDL